MIITCRVTGDVHEEKQGECEIKGRKGDYRMEQYNELMDILETKDHADAKRRLHFLKDLAWSRKAELAQAKEAAEYATSLEKKKVEKLLAVLMCQKHLRKCKDRVVQGCDCKACALYREITSK